MKAVIGARILFISRTCVTRLEPRLHRNVGMVVDQTEHSIKVKHEKDTIYLPYHMYHHELGDSDIQQNLWTILDQHPPHT